MKRKKIENNIFMIARKSAKERKLDYYMQLRGKGEFYMFTRNYSDKCYEVCKAGVPINNILRERQRNRAMMNLVSYLKFMLPYFIEIFDLRTIA